MPRQVMQLSGDRGETGLELPGGLWCNVLTGDEMNEGPVRVGELLARVPVGLLSQKDTTG